MDKHQAMWGEESPTPKGDTIFKEPSYIETVDNHIYFYAYVSKDQILQLNKRLRELSASLQVVAAREEREPANIFLHINSYGGSIFDGLAGMDEILKTRVSVTTIIEGACASAATFLSVVGSHRIIRPNSFMLIHQLSASTWGNYHELVDFKKNVDRLMKQIKTIYKNYTKVPMTKIDEILDHDIWFDPETSLKYGLVDEVG